ncbi:hypothetical protein [Bacillus sp. AK031]
MENEVMKARLKRAFMSYARRYRSCLKNGTVVSVTPETITKQVFQQLSLVEVERIIQDIEVIRDRGGEAGEYLKMIVYGFQDNLNDSSEVNGYSSY